jgi:hypothetical protein
LSRALVTGFLLHTLLGEESLEELVSGELKRTELLLSRPALDG